MTDFTIENLHKDVLLEIFDFLDAKSLKSCALVCKEWDTIIGTSTSTMRKLPLIFKSNWVAKEREIKGLKRHFHSIIFDSVAITNKTLAKVIKKIGSHVRYFELDKVHILHVSFNEILSSLVMLEKLIIVESSIDEAVKKIAESSLKSLKSLVLIRSEWRFFDYFTTSNTQVKELKIASSNYGESDSKNFDSFIAKQKNLESLAVYVRQGNIYKSLAKSEEQNLKFKLKRLSVDYKFWGDDSSTDEALMKFLSSQQSSLEDLETCKTLSDKILEHILSSLKLKRLIIDASGLPSRQLFYNAIRPNKYLKTLILNDEIDNFEVLRGLLHIYQSTEKLVINNWPNEIINDCLIFLANNLKSLKHLEIASLANDTPELPIPSLKTFHVDFVDNVAHWQAFCVNNPSIETLSVKWLTNRNTFTYEVIDHITTQMPNLKHIKFGAYFNPTTRMLELMSRNCQNLRKLEVFAENASELESNANIDHGKFKVIYYPPEAVINVFKEEPTLWEQENNFGLDSDSGSDFSDDPDDMSIDDYEDEQSDWDDWDGDDIYEHDFDDVFGLGFL